MTGSTLHGGDPSVLRRLNSVAVLRALRAGGEPALTEPTLTEPTLTELAGQVSLSRPTTEGALQELAARGLVAEVAPDPAGRLGRPARRYRFRAEAGYALGIEISSHRTLMYVVDLNGRVVGEHRAELDVSWPSRERLAAVRRAVRACLAAAGVARADLWAVAAGTPGVVDRTGRVAMCTVVPDWQGVDLARELGRSFSCPILVANDANLAAVAERWRGAAERVDDVVYVLAGMHTGVGAIVGGRLHRGRFGAAGEIGMLPELGLRDTAALIAGTVPRDGRAEAAAAEVLAAARDGDSAALARVEHVAGRMARGIAAMVLALDPETVIVGGPLTLGGDLLVGELRRQVLPLCLGPTRIEVSALGDEAVALGAVRIALDRIEEDLFRIGGEPSG